MTATEGKPLLVSTRPAFVPDDILALVDRIKFLEDVIFAEFEAANEGVPDDLKGLEPLLVTYGTPGFKTIEEHLEDQRAMLTNSLPQGNGAPQSERTALYMVLGRDGRALCVTGNTKHAQARAEYIAILLQHRMMERFFERYPQLHSEGHEPPA